jgi:tRNA modification GTPase
VTTIYAVSSGRPPAAIAVIRISGPAAFAAVEVLAGTLPDPRRTSLRALRSADGGLLDRALVLVFPGPDTATGEDLAELHCHGGRAVVDAVERALAVLPGLRPAVAGEFTRRALINGRIDLAEAEGLADLLSAETERQRLAALSAAEGQVSRCVSGWLDRLAMLSARVEAELDFADEDDVAGSSESLSLIGADAKALATDMMTVIDRPPVERLRDGIRVVLGGPPNSGKSTLINLLAGREVAIVSPVSGTTRDRIEAPVVRDGLPFVLTDTAGLTDRTDDAIEQIGVLRATAAIAAADILVWLGDEAPPRDAVWVHARADVAGREIMPVGPTVAVSIADPDSVADLWTAIATMAERLLPAVDSIALTREQISRCRMAAAALYVDIGDPLLFAEDLRTARGHLSAILGIDSTEHMLDALFSRFCIGK